VITPVFSGAIRTHRAVLDQALASVWDGGAFTVIRFGRFARNTAEANDIFTDRRGRVCCALIGGACGRTEKPGASCDPQRPTHRCRAPPKRGLILHSPVLTRPVGPGV
jgi:hypothetical protein